MTGSDFEFLLGVLCFLFLIWFIITLILIGSRVRQILEYQERQAQLLTMVLNELSRQGNSGAQKTE